VTAPKRRAMIQDVRNPDATSPKSRTAEGESSDSPRRGQAVLPWGGSSTRPGGRTGNSHRRRKSIIDSGLWGGREADCDRCAPAPAPAHCQVRALAARVLRQEFLPGVIRDDVAVRVPRASHDPRRGQHPGAAASRREGCRFPPSPSLRREQGIPGSAPARSLRTEPCSGTNAAGGEAMLRSARLQKTPENLRIFGGFAIQSAEFLLYSASVTEAPFSISR